MPAEVLVRLERVDTPLSPGTIHFHPRYEHFLKRCGLETAADVLDLSGEIVCGHPTRHVARVELKNRVVYLKREHVVGWQDRFKNARAGFGWVSKCEREARTLQRLEAAGLTGPQWLAYGTDVEGRAFLMIDELAGTEARRLLGDTSLSLAQRRKAIAAAGRSAAALHDAGFATPELAAKHLFVGPDRDSATLIDWQSAPPPGTVAEAERIRSLAGLHASVAEDLAGPRDRLRFLRAYLGTRGRTRHRLRSIEKLAAKQRSRSSKRDQRQSTVTAPQRLVWLRGEEVCAIPDLVPFWPRDVDGPPFYIEGHSQHDEEWVTFSNGRRGLVKRFRTTDLLGRTFAALRGRPWRSPGATAGRILFHLERFGIPAPRLLAFGQRTTGRTTAESFVLFEPTPNGFAVSAAIERFSAENRDELLNGAGRLLRRLHDAGCRLRSAKNPRLTAFEDGKLELSSPFAVELFKRISNAVRARDQTELCNRELGISNDSDRQTVLASYAGAGRIAGNWVR